MVTIARVQRGRRCLPTTAASWLGIAFLVKIASGAGSNKDTVVVDGFPAVVSTNRCSDLNLTGFGDAMNCGPPLSAPCFDFSRCRGEPAVYVYDPQVR